MEFISYSAIVLDERSVTKILNIFKDIIPNDWSIICHHMTINMGPLPQETKKFLGSSIRLTIESVGYDEKVIALGVSGFESKNKNPHITLAINKEKGGKPVMSNNLSNWQKIPRINVTGKVTEVQSQ